MAISKLTGKEVQPNTYEAELLEAGALLKDRGIRHLVVLGRRKPAVYTGKGLLEGEVTIVENPQEVLDAATEEGVAGILPVHTMQVGDELVDPKSGGITIKEAIDAYPGVDHIASIVATRADGPIHLAVVAAQTQ